MISRKRVEDMQRIREAQGAAIMRLSHRCPVIKRINEVLESEEVKKPYCDREFLLTLIDLRLADMPEADATRKVIKRILECSCGK